MTGEILLLTKHELTLMLDAAQRAVREGALIDMRHEREAWAALVTRALVRICELGDSAQSSALVRELRDAVTPCPTNQPTVT